MMKTLADLKRDLTTGNRVKLVYRNGQELNSLREVAKVTTTAVKFNALDGTKAGWLDYPKASLLEYNGGTVRIYQAGLRDLTDEEQRARDNEPRDKEQEERDMMADTNTMFYRRRRYYKDIGMEHLFGGSKKRNGMRLTYKDGKPKIQDDKVKGNLLLVYEIVDGIAE